MEVSCLCYEFLYPTTSQEFINWVNRVIYNITYIILMKLNIVRAIWWVILYSNAYFNSINVLHLSIHEYWLFLLILQIYSLYQALHFDIYCSEWSIKFNFHVLFSKLDRVSSWILCRELIDRFRSRGYCGQPKADYCYRQPF